MRLYDAIANVDLGNGGLPVDERLSSAQHFTPILTFPRWGKGFLTLPNLPFSLRWKRGRNE